MADSNNLGEIEMGMLMPEIDPSWTKILTENPKSSLPK